MSFGTAPGYNGQLVSLGGVKGRPGLGIRVENTGYTGALIAAQLIPSNPSRLWMLVQNSGLERTYIAFGPDGGGIAGSGLCYLDPGDYLQIDRDIPWWGSLSASSVGTVQLSVAEASIIG